MAQPFNVSDFLPFKGPGPANLDGQAFMKTVGGDVKTCAGNPVYLIPSTPYNDEVVVHSQLGSITNRDPQATQFTRSGICDVSGKFSFEKVPARRWYIVATVKWGVPTENGINAQGGEVMKVVDLKSGQNQVILTDADAAGNANATGGGR